MRLKNIIILMVVLIIGSGVLFIFNRPENTKPEYAKIYVWDIPDTDLQHVDISLPREHKSQSFIKISQGDKFPWFFDDVQKSPVNAEKWGGGIPLLLSGPSADRVIAEEATDDQLAEYGLLQPTMEIKLLVTDGRIIQIDVGDNTPDKNNVYVRIPDSYGVATVDYTWYYVLRELIVNPPYASATTTTVK